ncbi:MAG: hypothetical protein JWP82_1591, partial [Humibacillus sp.]|nr:hypothetical protein [Humibacillus sp.]
MTVQTPPRPRGGPAAVVGSGLSVGLVALLLAQLGTAALYAVLGVIAVGLVLWLLRDDLRAPVTDRLVRLWTARGTNRTAQQRGSATRVGVGLTVVATIGAAAVAWVVATQGGKAIGALVGLLVVGLAALLLWPLVTGLARGAGLSRSAHSTPTTVECPVPDSSGPSRSAHSTGKGRSGVVALLLVAAAGAGMAWVLATLGTKGLLAAGGL